MKTQILQLEDHDDAVSTRDKMGWDKAGRILLVWPERGRILTRKLDLVLLQRRSFDLGAQMALVTTDGVVRQNASELHIPVFTSSLEAQNNRWRAPRRRLSPPPPPRNLPDLDELKSRAHPREAAWLNKPAARLAFFALGVISFFAVVAVLLPGAEIELLPKTQIQQTSLSVSASQNTEAVRLSGEIPVYTTTVEVEGRETISTTGITLVPEKPATGYVRFTNLTQAAVEVPKGTVVTSSQPDGEDLSFMTTSDGEVPAGVGQTASLAVRAMQPGTASNLPSGSLTALEGTLGLTLAVTNSVGTSGGTERTVAAARPQDYAQISKQLTANLARTALEEFQRTLEPGDLLITSTFTPVSDSNSFIPPIPSNSYAQLPAADELNLTSRQTFEIEFVKGGDLQKLAQGVLDAGLPDTQMVKPGTLEVRSVSMPQVGADGNVKWKIYTQRSVQAVINASQVVNIVLGKSPAEASRLLTQQLPLEAAPAIKLIPSWWPMMPVMSFRIGVSIR